jgi:hypothetical protein
MSGGSDTQTTTTTNQPYKASKPLLDTAMGDAMKMYNNGNLNPSNDIKTAIPYDDATKKGMTKISNNANAAIDADRMGPALRQMGNIWGQGGFNNQQQTAMNPMIATARGDFLNRPDANFEDVLSRTKDNAGTDVNSMMSGMGRFAGGAHQGIFADTMGGIESQARLGQYNLERDRQTAAAGQLFDMGQQGQSNLSNAGSVYQGLLAGKDAPANALMGVGAMREDLAGRQKNDEIRMADSKLNDLRTLLGISSGAGGYGSQTAQMPMQNNGWSNALGAGMGGLGLMSMLGGF